MADTPKTPAAPPAAAKKPETKQRFTARLRYARISARKMRYVVDLVRGKDFNTALGILRTCAKRGAPFCKKLLESAYENAMDIARNKNMDIDGNRLHVVEARVDGGPIIKRWRPSSVRRPTMIKKRTCHVLFVLEERDLKESKKDRAKRQRQDRKAKSKQEPAAPQAKPAEPKPAEPKAEAPKTDAQPPKTEEKK
jgi:large subunit ribosomal protein L22